MARARARERMPRLSGRHRCAWSPPPRLSAKICAHADAVVIEGYQLGAAELAAAPRLRAVQKFGTITGNIDLAACAARGIPVLTLRRRANIACAEHAIALMLMLARKLTA